MTRLMTTTEAMTQEQLKEKFELSDHDTVHAAHLDCQRDDNFIMTYCGSIESRSSETTDEVNCKTCDLNDYCPNCGAYMPVFS